MKNSPRTLVTIGAVLCFLVSWTSLYGQSSLWATAYYAGWMQGMSNNGYLTTQNIDFSAVTHIVHFSLVPNSDGSLNSSSNSITATNSSTLISAAHAAGKKVLVCVGGWGSDSGFRGATSAATLTTFVSNLVSFVTSRGYDGIDIDWEVLQSSDAAQYTALITALRTAMNALTPRHLLTASAGWQPSIFAQLQGSFDQINVMTYDMSGAWPGWVTWHNSPVYDGGFRFPSTGGLVPSIDGTVSSFLSAGVAPGKLGIGIDFYGYVWSGGAGTPTGGVTAPRQSWSTAPTVQDNVPYYTIMTSYYQSQYYHWDASAQAAYLGIDNSGSSSDKFISYDNESSVQAKFAYARTKGLGGLIVWELGAGYRADQPAGQRDLLLQAVKAALGGSAPPPKDTVAPVVAFLSPANGSTVSGTVSLSASATDNVGVTGVQFVVDGSALGAAVAAPPYTASWNSSLAAAGTHSLSATAYDAAGNSAAASVTLTVSSLPPPPTTAGLTIYQDALQPPWINTSWGATVSFTSAVQVHSGTASMQVVQRPWGALSLHSGSWGSTVHISPSLYSSLQFSIYAASTGGTKLRVLCENDKGNSFPAYVYGTIPQGQWVTVSVPLATLDPSLLAIDRIDISDITGLSKTYYVDDVTLRTSATIAQLVAPTSFRASDAAADQSSDLRWSASPGAETYQLQVSRDPGFASSAVNLADLRDTTWTPSGVASGLEYYWRARAIRGADTSNWSPVYSFASPGISAASTVGMVTRQDGSIPTSFELAQNFPNPFNPTTTIMFSVARPGNVSVVVYNLLGEEVARLFSGNVSAGQYSVDWNSAGLPSGFYTCRMTAEGFAQTIKMIVAK